MRKPPVESVRGTLIVPDARYRKMIRLRFEIPPADFEADSLRSVPQKLDAFYQLLQQHYSSAAITMSLDATPALCKKLSSEFVRPTWKLCCACGW